MLFARKMDMAVSIVHSKICTETAYETAPENFKSLLSSRPTYILCFYEYQMQRICYALLALSYYGGGDQGLVTVEYSPRPRSCC